MNPSDFKLSALPKPNARKRLSLYLKVAVALFVLSLSTSIWFTVEPEEVAVILQFGRYHRTLQPGLHFKLPIPIETVRKVPVQRQLKEEFGFRTLQAAGGRTVYSNKDFSDESLLLTGDLNVAVVEWITQYRISDERAYLFKVRNAVSTFRDMNEAVMRQVIGDHSVNEVLTVGRQQISDEVAKKLQNLCDQYQNGLHVEQIVLQNVTPPDKVKPSFNEVNQAQQERERMINEAKAEFNRIIPKAKGQAQETIAQSQGYALDRVNRARGDADRFRALWQEYRSAPDVTRKRIYLETMAEIFPRVKHKIIVDDDIKSVLPLLNLEGVKP
ncbi:MAG: FtsH protease activity modulator HflK [Candidatus Schekmanbacteria bacterium]|nr:FtsH protease activity modulator HflK [Candidatus Schekmanbacteria bacterium]